MGQPKVFGLVSDLMFTVRIGEAAKRANVDIKFVKSTNDLIERADADTGLIILDLNNNQIDLTETIRELKSRAETKNIKLLGFVSHVETERIRAAREAGCDTVLARSAFVAGLPEIFGSSALGGQLP
jgi:CheY-like chemotaxis protein